VDEGTRTTESQANAKNNHSDFGTSQQRDTILGHSSNHDSQKDGLIVSVTGKSGAVQQLSFGSYSSLAGNIKDETSIDIYNPDFVHSFESDGTVDMFCDATEKFIYLCKGNVLTQVNFHTGEKLKDITLPVNASADMTYLFDAGSNTLFTGSTSGEVNRYDTMKEESLGSFKPFNGSGKLVFKLADYGKIFAIQQNSGVLASWDADDFSGPQVNNVDNGLQFTCVDYSDEYDITFLATNKGKVEVLNGKDSKRLTASDHMYPVDSMAIINDGTNLVACCEKRIAIWNIPKLPLIQEIALDTTRIYHISVLTRNIAAVRTSESPLELWSTYDFAKYFEIRNYEQESDEQKLRDFKNFCFLPRTKQLVEVLKNGPSTAGVKFIKHQIANYNCSEDINYFESPKPIIDFKTSRLFTQQWIDKCPISGLKTAKIDLETFQLEYRYQGFQKDGLARLILRRFNDQQYTDKTPVIDQYIDLDYKMLVDFTIVQKQPPRFMLIQRKRDAATAREKTSIKFISIPNLLEEEDRDNTALDHIITQALIDQKTNRLFLGDIKGNLHRYMIEEKKWDINFGFHFEAIKHIEKSEEKQYLFSCCNENVIKIWQMESLELVRYIALDFKISRLLINDGARMLAACRSTGLCAPCDKKERTKKDIIRWQNNPNLIISRMKTEGPNGLDNNTTNSSEQEKLRIEEEAAVDIYEDPITNCDHSHRVEQLWSFKYFEPVTSPELSPQFSLLDFEIRKDSISNTFSFFKKLNNRFVVSDLVLLQALRFWKLSVEEKLYIKHCFKIGVNDNNFTHCFKSLRNIYDNSFTLQKYFNAYLAAAVREDYNAFGVLLEDETYVPYQFHPDQLSPLEYLVHAQASEFLKNALRILQKKEQQAVLNITIVEFLQKVDAIFCIEFLVSNVRVVKRFDVLALKDKNDYRSSHKGQEVDKIGFYEEYSIVQQPFKSFLKETYRKFESKSPSENKREIVIYDLNLYWDFRNSTKSSLSFLESFSKAASDRFITSPFAHLVKSKWNEKKYSFFYRAFLQLLHLVFYFWYMSNNHRPGGFFIDIIVLGLIVIYEFWNLVCGPIRYLKDVWNWFDLANIGTSTALLVHKFKHDGVDPSDNFKTLVLISLLANIWRAFAYFRFIPKMAHVTQMAMGMLKKVMSIVIVVVYFGICLSVVYTLASTDEFAPSISGALDANFLLIMGNVPEVINKESGEKKPYSILQIIIIGLSSYLLPIFFMNYLIAKLSATYAELEKRQLALSLRELASSLFENESMVKGFNWITGNPNNESKNFIFLAVDAERVNDLTSDGSEAQHFVEVTNNVTRESKRAQNILRTGITSMQDRMKKGENEFMALYNELEGAIAGSGRQLNNSSSNGSGKLNFDSEKRRNPDGSGPSRRSRKKNKDLNQDTTIDKSRNGL
jgi:hypothetical protein